MAPIIKLSPEAEVKLTAWSILTGSREFSGLGLIEKEGETFHVTDVELLGVGSWGFTEFAPERSRAILENPKCKLWFHRHPISGWSGTDENTATREPLGGPPQLVRWSVAIVLTPAGWIGRVDVHVPQPKTFHCPVEPKVASPEVIEAAKQLITPELEAYGQELLAEFEAMHGKHCTISEVKTYSDVDFNVYDEPEENAEFFCPDCGGDLQLLGDEDVSGVMSVTFFECKNCGGFAVLPDYYSCEVIDPFEHARKSRKPAWRQTNWWNRIIGR